MDRYKLARLYDQGGDLSKRWFVAFSYLHPETLKYKLFKSWISTRLLTRRSRILRAHSLIDDINNRLLNGYNPFENENPGFTRLIDALDKILSFKSTYARYRTVLTYKSYVNNFKKWVHQAGYDNVMIEAFNYQKAIEFAEYLKIIRKVKNRTFNNYIEHFRTLFNDLIKKEYIIRNPFSKIEFLPDCERSVFAYTKEELELLKNYMPLNNPRIWLACQFVFYCALRPAELVRLKIKYIDLINHKIYIPAEISKTKRQDVINIPDPFMDDLKNVFGSIKNHEFFIFSKRLIPGSFPIAPTRLAEEFRKEAEKIGLTRKLYELKHTGAGLVIEAGANIRDLQLHLRHTNINTTEIYLKAFKSSTSENFIKKFPKL